MLKIEPGTGVAKESDAICIVLVVAVVFPRSLCLFQLHISWRIGIDRNDTMGLGGWVGDVGSIFVGFAVRCLSSCVRAWGTWGFGGRGEDWLVEEGCSRGEPSRAGYGAIESRDSSAKARIGEARGDCRISGIGTYYGTEVGGMGWMRCGASLQ